VLILTKRKDFIDLPMLDCLEREDERTKIMTIDSSNVEPF
jgi:hypothetical protein